MYDLLFHDRDIFVFQKLKFKRRAISDNLSYVANYQGPCMRHHRSNFVFTCFASSCVLTSVSQSDDLIISMSGNITSDRRSESPVSPTWGDQRLSDLNLVLRSKEKYLFAEEIACMSQQASVICFSCGFLAVPDRSGLTHSYEQTAGCSSDSVLHLHASVMSESDFFRTLFSTRIGAPHTCLKCKAQIDVAYCELEGRELEAGPYVLKYMYTKLLPTHDGAVRDGMLLMWMLLVSNGGR